jgi:signal peptidase II
MFYYTLIIWLILDFISKYFAVIYLQKQINIFWNYLFLKQVYNPGIAFWIEVPKSLLKIWTILLIIWIFWYYRVELKWEKNIKNKKLINFSFWLIISWAIANAYERIFNEKVIDFIWIKYFSVFNLADSFITIWAIILIYYYYKKWVSDQEK